MLARAGVKQRGFYGSWESHRAVARRALHFALPRVLILEDDFCVLKERSSPSALRQVGTDLEGLRDWDLFFLGHQPMYPTGWPRCEGRIFPTASCWIHAYLLSSSGQRILAEHGYVEVARGGVEQTLDGWLRGATRQFAVLPMLVVQSCAISDNVPPTDHYGRLLQWWTRVHKHHSLAIERAVLLVAPLLLLILLLSFVFRLARKPQHQTLSEPLSERHAMMT
jgi:hypothetical protein